jgi:hypothetical protein
VEVFHDAEGRSYHLRPHGQGGKPRAPRLVPLSHLIDPSCEGPMPLGEGLGRGVVLQRDTRLDGEEFDVRGEGACVHTGEDVTRVLEGRASGRTT